MKIVIVGEAFGYEESKVGKPFVGPSGELLNELLEKVGIKRSDCLVTNVFMQRPPGNDVSFFFLKPKAIAERHPDLKFSAVNKSLQGINPLPELAQYTEHPRHKDLGFLNPLFASELLRLKGEIAGADVVIALGNTALWALTGKTGISDLRGTFQECRWDKKLKVMPTFHPAAVLREWKFRVPVMADLRKAVDPKEPPVRTVWVAERLEDVKLFTRMHIRNEISFDVEEEGTRQITSFSVAAGPTISLVVPIFDPKTGDNSWTVEEEILLWLWVKSLLTRRDLTVIMHNALYDLSMLLLMEVEVASKVKDTMLMHHAYQPEMRKSLGMLASLYCDETAWKTLRTWGKGKVNKTDE